jgi:CRP/FNR family cyclic AMP-dependent transcriptional regulator
MATTRSDAALALSPRTLSDEELRAFSAHGTARSFPKNAAVVNEGERSDAIYFILSGRVKVYLRNQGGKEVVLNVHGPGEYFGELILDEGPRSASVVTLEPSKLLAVTKADFRQFVLSHPDFAMKLIQRLMGRVRALTDNVKNLALMDVYGRVARLLLELAAEEDGEMLVREKLTHRDIASRVGASREMVSRILKDLVSGGYIRTKNRQIVLDRDLPARW